MRGFFKPLFFVENKRDGKRCSISLSENLNFSYGKIPQTFLISRTHYFRIFQKK